MDKIKKSLIIAFIVLLTLIWMVMGVYLAEFSGVWILSIMLSLLMTMFCIVDAKDVNYRLPWSTYWIILLFWPIAVPVYLFSSRKGKKKLIACGYIASFFTVCIIGVIIGYVTLPWAAYYAHDYGEYKLAINLYSSLINSDKNDAWAYYNRGNAYESIGFPFEREKDHKKAKSLDPSLFTDEETDGQEDKILPERINITDDPLDKNIEKAQLIDAIQHKENLKVKPEAIDLIVPDEIIIEEERKKQNRNE